jgi:Mn2+/Fe2+ NRAMP family transporter
VAPRSEQEIDAGTLVLHSYPALDGSGRRDFARINPVKALYWTGSSDGLSAPFLLVTILIVASDKELMQGQPSSRLGWTVVAITTVAMFAAGFAMFVV